MSNTHTHTHTYLYIQTPKEIEIQNIRKGFAQLQRLQVITFAQFDGSYIDHIECIQAFPRFVKYILITLFNNHFALIPGLHTKKF